MTPQKKKTRSSRVTVGQARRLAPVEPAPDMPAWQLHGLNPENGGVCHFNVISITIGRGTENDLVIDKSTVSSLHASIYCKDGSFYIEDQRSTNGTCLNNRKLPANQPVRLKSGDRLEFANYAYRFIRTDQLVSGQTVMLSASAMNALMPKPKMREPFEMEGMDGGLIKNTLENQLDEIRLLGEKYAEFVTERFSEAVIQAIATQAEESLQETLADSAQHCAPVVKGRTFYLVCSLPVSIDEAARWFSERNNGFIQFVHKWILSEAYNEMGCDVFCAITFGMELEPWSSITIVPTANEEDTVEIMSVDFLTEEEKKSLSLVFDDHGCVL